MSTSFVVVILCGLLAFDGLPVTALAEAVGDEVVAVDAEVSGDACSVDQDNAGTSYENELLEEGAATGVLGDESAWVDNSAVGTDANSLDTRAIDELDLNVEGPTTYTVSFDPNGGVGSMVDQVMTRDISVVLNANTYTRDGYTFTSWNTQADGSGASYKDGQQVENLGEAESNVKLYAQWTALPEEIELTAQATALPQTINTAAFTLTLPNYWTGKVKAQTSQLSGRNVGSLTKILTNDGDTLVLIHWAKSSQYSRMIGLGDAWSIGTKSNSDYAVEVIMDNFPWMYYDSSDQSAGQRNAVDLLTGGAYKSAGSTSGAAYEDSRSAAKTYVKNNILSKISLKKAPVTGKWVQSGSRWWYSWSNGTYPKSQFLTIAGSTYYFDASGWMVTGWRKVSGAWYYFSSSGAMKKNAWVKSGSYWYWMDTDGKMATGWKTVNKKKYWFSSSGVMATGWKKISNNWYFFDSTGAMVQSKWVGNYYLGKDGIMLTNTVTPDGYRVLSDGRWDGKGKVRTVSTAAFTVTLPSGWSGSARTDTRVSPCMTTVDGGVLTFVWSKNSEYRNVSLKGGVRRVATKKGLNYTVDVYMTLSPWGGESPLAYTITSFDKAALSKLTGGKYKTPGSYGTSAFDASQQYAVRYVEQNIVAKLVVK